MDLPLRKYRPHRANQPLAPADRPHPSRSKALRDQSATHKISDKVVPGPLTFIRRPQRERATAPMRALLRWEAARGDLEDRIKGRSHIWLARRAAPSCAALGGPGGRRHAARARVYDHLLVGGRADSDRGGAHDPPSRRVRTSEPRAPPPTAPWSRRCASAGARRGYAIWEPIVEVGHGRFKRAPGPPLPRAPGIASTLASAGPAQ
jgi:hypothetical protein